MGINVPEIFKVGKYQGTARQFSKITGVSDTNMRERIKKFRRGVYSAEECMTVGPISTSYTGGGGNAAWDALSPLTKDARLSVKDVAG